MPEINTQFIRECIAKGDLHPFYNSRTWKRLRSEVLAEDKHECQYCKAEGKYEPADHVHHVNHVDKHPELALSKTYVDADGVTKRNLISTSKNCHELKGHPERLPYHGKVRPEPLTEERW